MTTTQLSIDQFTGPLDLLLHLIRVNEMDIFDLDISSITEQYLAVIEQEGVRDLEGAYHFLAMAASLVEMKSRLLLPRPEPEEGEDGEAGEAVIDPLTELSQKLAAYQGIQEVTGDLQAMYLQTGRHWPRQIVEKMEAEIVYTMDSLSVYDLMTAFREVLDRPRFRQVTIFRDDFDSEAARTQARERISQGPQKLTDLLIEQHNVFALIITFIVLLEMIKEGEITFARRDDAIVLEQAKQDDLI
ncbi:segregation/condensation protein A [bacterium]|nr:segregation/condensation protein A [bacterium]